MGRGRKGGRRKKIVMEKEVSKFVYIFLSRHSASSKWVQTHWSGDRGNTNIFSSQQGRRRSLHTRARMGEYYEQYSAYVFVRGKACQKAEHLRIFKTLSPYQSIQTYFGVTMKELFENSSGPPWWSSVQDSALHCWGARVQLWSESYDPTSYMVRPKNLKILPDDVAQDVSIW